MQFSNYITRQEEKTWTLQALLFGALFETRNFSEVFCPKFYVKILVPKTFPNGNALSSSRRNLSILCTDDQDCTKVSKRRTDYSCGRTVDGGEIVIYLFTTTNTR